MGHDTIPEDHVLDFITGRPVPLMGPEENRQAVERFLVHEKGYAREDIIVDEPLTVRVTGERYTSRVDLAVYVEGNRFMVIKCASGSLGSREREILAAARLTAGGISPFAMVSDGKTAIILDTVTGKNLHEGLDRVWSRTEAKKVLESVRPSPLPEERMAKEALIYKSYDSMNINRVG